MKRFLRRILPFLLSCVISLLPALGAPALADGDMAGSTDEESIFYVTASRSGYIKLKGVQGNAYAADTDYYGNPAGYKSESAYGFYHVQVAGTDYAKAYEWAPSAQIKPVGTVTDPALIIVFPGAGEYKVTVTPMTREEIDNTYWPANRFQYWIDPASWQVSARINCTVNASGTDPQPSASGRVTVNCYDGAGTFLTSYTETLTQSGTIYPRNLNGYVITSSGKYITFSGGVCTPAAVNFYYSPFQTTAALTVNCYDTSGNFIRSYTETVTASGTVYPRAITGYTVNSGGQYVSLTGAGASPASLTFYYRKNASSARLTVNCYDGSGNFLQSYTETISSTTTIYPRGISGYNATSSAVYVTFNADGSISPASVNFYYQSRTPAGSVAVTCYDDHGNLIKSYTETVTESRNINPPAITGYTALSGAQTVTYEGGVCTPSAVSFTYNLTGGNVNPGYYTDPNMVVPLQWDTQFKPGTATANGGSNAGLIDNLYKLYDNDPNTAFSWTYWNSEGSDDIPEFTIYFDNASINYIAIRNGIANNPEASKKYGLVTRMKALIYDNAGNVYTHEFDVARTIRDTYWEYPLGQVFQNVTKIELFVIWITNGTEHKYVLQMSDVAFLCKP